LSEKPGFSYFAQTPVIDKIIIMWYDIFKNSTAVRKIDKKESE